MQIQMKVIRPRKRDYGAAVEAEIAAEAEKAKKEMIAGYEAIQRTWKAEHKAKITGRKYVNAKETRIVVTAQGGTLPWVDQGTKPHLIKAKTKRGLVFKTGYQPKTLPGQKSGSSLPRYVVAGPTGAQGEWVRVQEVHHPGTRPREFTKHMATYWQTEWRRRMDAAVKRGVRKAK